MTDKFYNIFDKMSGVSQNILLQEILHNWKTNYQQHVTLDRVTAIKLNTVANFSDMNTFFTTGDVPNMIGDLFLHIDYDCLQEYLSTEFKYGLFYGLYKTFTCPKRVYRRLFFDETKITVIYRFEFNNTINKNKWHKFEDTWVKICEDFITIIPKHHYSVENPLTIKIPYTIENLSSDLASDYKTFCEDNSIKYNWFFNKMISERDYLYIQMIINYCCVNKLTDKNIKYIIIEKSKIKIILVPNNIIRINFNKLYSPCIITMI
jgi:hypothetical protein